MDDERVKIERTRKVVFKRKSRSLNQEEWKEYYKPIKEELKRISKNKSGFWIEGTLKLIQNMSPSSKKYIDEFRIDTDEEGCAAAGKIGIDTIIEMCNKQAIRDYDGRGGQYLLDPDRLERHLEKWEEERAEDFMVSSTDLKTVTASMLTRDENNIYKETKKFLLRSLDKEIWIGMLATKRFLEDETPYIRTYLFTEVYGAVGMINEELENNTNKKISRFCFDVKADRLENYVKQKYTISDSEVNFFMLTDIKHKEKTYIHYEGNKDFKIEIG